MPGTSYPHSSQAWAALNSPQNLSWSEVVAGMGAAGLRGWQWLTLTQPNHRGWADPLPEGLPEGQSCEDRVRDGPASGGKGSKGRNYLDCIRGNGLHLPEEILSLNCITDSSRGYACTALRSHHWQPHPPLTGGLPGSGGGSPPHRGTHVEAGHRGTHIHSEEVSGRGLPAPTDRGAARLCGGWQGGGSQAGLVAGRGVEQAGGRPGVRPPHTRS